MDKKLLTISIPTYNRNEILKKNLEVLLPQIAKVSDLCGILLFDNCSPTPVETTIRPVLDKFPQIEASVRRNRANVGANANIMRCLEATETEWVWVLSDDDTPLPDALENILHQIQTHPDALFLNYSFDENRKRDYHARGLKDFVDKLDFSANLPWISSSVYRVGAMQDSLKFGYQFTYTMVPHLVTLLMSLDQNKDKDCYFFTRGLMEIEVEMTPVEQQWSIVNLALGTPILFDLPFESRLRKKLVKKLLVTHMGESVNLRIVTYQLLLGMIKNGDQRNILYLYDQIARRGFLPHASLRRRLELIAFRLMLRFPKVTGAAYRLLKRKKLGSFPVQDRYERM